MLRLTLQGHGAIVDSAASVVTALERLGKMEHDVIISDIGMPEVDGYEFLRRVRSWNAKIPAIALTAFAGSKDRLLALEAGFNMHVTKPIQPELLIEAVSTLVRTISAG
jgi:CheY-like chemotaxis protein